MLRTFSNYLTIEVNKAQPLGDQVIPDVTITINGQPPEWDYKDPKWRERHVGYYDVQAEAIYRGLRYLPGGTFDRLLLKMLEGKVSLLKIPHLALMDTEDNNDASD